MRDLIVNLIKEGAKELYDIHGHVYPWRLGRNLGISVEVVEGHLIKLGRAKSLTYLRVLIFNFSQFKYFLTRN